MKAQILVIDDEEGVRDAFTMALEDMEYQVDTAETGEKGLGMFGNSKYDLIYLDLNTPGINGVEILRKIRKINKSVHVYIITSFSQPFSDELESVTEDGIAFNLMEKPLSRDQIIAETQGILGQFIEN
ncbi:MAG: response regulator [Candidatus Anammoxibacter sp.]